MFSFVTPGKQIIWLYRQAVCIVLTSRNYQPMPVNKELKPLYNTEPDCT